MAAVLFVPVRYRLNAGYIDKLNVYVKASWLLRIFTVIYNTDAQPAFALQVFGRAGRRKAKRENNGSDADSSETKDIKQKKSKQAKQKKDKKVGDVPNKRGIKFYWRKFTDYQYKEALVKRTLLLVKRTVKALLPSQADGECRFGFEDPSATGMALGAAHALLGMTDSYSHVNIGAVFDRKFFYLQCRMSGKLSIWSLTWPLAAYALSRPVWIILKPLIFKKKSKG